MRKKSTIVVAIGFAMLFVAGAWAQRGSWDGCTLQSMKRNLTDQQIGGYFLHESAALVNEAARTIPRARTLEQRKRLANILAKISREMDSLAYTMGGKRLSQRDIERFHHEISRARKIIGRVSR